MIASSLIVAVLCVCFGGIARIAGAALFSGIVAYTVIGIVDISVMVFTAFILWPIMKTGHRISRAEGCALLLVYVAYTAWLIHSA